MLSKLLAWAPESLVRDFSGINFALAYESRSSNMYTFAVELLQLS